MSLYGDVRRWWASRTINFGALLIIAGQALEFMQSREQVLLQYFGEYGPAVFTGVGVVVIVLRVVTTQPIVKPKA
jgi:hypothetical protein